MNILITGGAGFIGSHIADTYIEAGHNVIILDNLSSGSKSNINPKCKFYQADISDDIDYIFKQNKIDLINHHAAQIDLRLSQEDPLKDIEINISSGVKLLQTAVKNGIKKIIFASSGGAIYGEQREFPADEKHVTEPLSPYGIDKLTFEKYLKFYKDYYGLEYICLRYSNVYGPRQSIKGEAGVVSIFIKKILKNEILTINGDGEQTRDYVFVGDVAKANLLALEFGASEIFNISTSKETSVNKLYSLIKNELHYKNDAIHGDEIKGEQKRSLLNPAKANKLLRWNAEINIEKGIEITSDWFKKNKELI